MTSDAIPADIPPAVAEQVNDVRDAGLSPQVERLHYRLWRITVRDDRVHAYADYRPDRHGVFRWVHGRLTVDGTEYPRTDPDVIATIMADPDAFLARRVADVPAMPDPQPLNQAPAVVRHTYATMRGRLTEKDEQLRVLLGRTPGGKWVIGVDFNDTSGMRVTFERTGKTRWNMARTKPIQLIVFGKDLTREAGSDLATALALATTNLAGGAPTAATPKAGTSSASSTAATRPNSVMVRNTTVIRV